jgi:ABC-2 type transport system permease protein
MTNVTSHPSEPEQANVSAVPAALLSDGFNFSGLGTLFHLTLRQHWRGKRLWVIAFLFTLPTFIAILIRALAQNGQTVDKQAQDIEFGLVFMLIPHLLIPLTALLYSSGMIQNEIEDQTLTYLLVLPLPKWAIYLVKFLATLLVTILLAAVFTTIASVAIYWGTSGMLAERFFARMAEIIMLQALALLGYCSLFGMLSVLTRWSFVAGVMYIILFEGVLANIDFAIRRATIMYNIRVLAQRRLNMTPEPWGITTAKAPSNMDCFLTLVVASLIFTAIAMFWFTVKEIRMKTPEGS